MVGAACVAVLCTRELRWGSGRGLLSRKMRCTETVVAALPLAKVFCKEIKILLKQKPVLHGNSARDGSIFLPSEFREPKRRAFCRDWQIYPCGGGFSCPRISLRRGGICPAFLRDMAVRDGFPHPLPDFLYPDRVKIIAQCAFFYLTKGTLCLIMEENAETHNS